MRTLEDTTLGISKRDYKAALRGLQVERVKLRRHFLRCDDKIWVLVEGRDTAGEEGERLDADG